MISDKEFLELLKAQERRDRQMTVSNFHAMADIPMFFNSNSDIPVITNPSRSASMSTKKFKKGDRVTVIGDCGFVDCLGKIGKIVNFDTDGQAGVEFDVDIDGHSCDGNANAKKGWYVDVENLGVIMDTDSKKFEEGDTVKFKEYISYNDWKAHDGQEATVLAQAIGKIVKDNFNVGVKWSDGKTSATSEDNLIMVTKSTKNKVVKIKVPMTEEKEGLSETMGNMLRQVALPKSHKQSILEALAQTDLKKYNKLFVEWGFGATLEKGKGIILFFYGEPGTGKTMCAEAIAEHLGRKHMILGTADLQSPVPGQMERKIKEAFAKAKSDNLVIVLDECDSLLYNRNHVGPIMGAEINCLLSEIERFEGVCVLTTNRNSLLDPALERRIALKLEFLPPDAATRAVIWRRLIPLQCPLGKCVDFKKLSEDYDLPGGNIKNIILSAARGAVHKNQDAILMEDFDTYAKKELKGREAFKKKKEPRALAMSQRNVRRDFVKDLFKDEGGLENNRNGKQ